MKILRFIVLDRADIPQFLRLAVAPRVTQEFDERTRRELTVGTDEFYRLVRHGEIEFDLWVRPDMEDGPQIDTDQAGRSVFARRRRGWQVDLRFRRGEALADGITGRMRRAVQTLPWKRRKSKAALTLRRFARLGFVEPETPDIEFAEWRPPEIVTDIPLPENPGPDRPVRNPIGPPPRSAR